MQVIIWHGRVPGMTANFRPNQPMLIDMGLEVHLIASHALRRNGHLPETGSPLSIAAFTPPAPGPATAVAGRAMRPVAHTGNAA